MDDYKRWLAADLEDPALTAELQKIEGQDEEIKDRFAVALKFGTAGLRGVLGAGSNRMNIYVVRQNTIRTAPFLQSFLWKAPRRRSPSGSLKIWTRPTTPPR